MEKLHLTAMEAKQLTFEAGISRKAKAEAESLAMLYTRIREGASMGKHDITIYMAAADASMTWALMEIQKDGFNVKLHLTRSTDSGHSDRATISWEEPK